MLMEDYSDDVFMRECARQNRELLKIAIRDGFLENGATVDDITISLSQRMADTYTLKDALRLGYLGPGAGIEDLTDSLRQELLDRGQLKEYLPDGSVFTNSPPPS